MDLLQTQEAMEIRLPAELFHEALFTLDTDPAGVLEYAREFQNLETDPFLARIAPRLRVLAAGGPSNGANCWPSREEEIKRLDLLRRRDRGLAKKQIEQLISSELGLMEQGPRPRRAFGELCGELGVLAAIYRIAARLDDAVDLLVLARPLVVLAADFRAEALWYQKAAYLLVDLKRFTRAEEFIVRAHEHFDVAGSDIERLRAVVDRSYVLTYANKHKDSLARLQAILPRLPATEVQLRIAANQLMSENLKVLGDLVGADRYLAVAFELAEDDLLAQACCQESRAKLEISLGDIPRAIAAYHAALPCWAKQVGIAELSRRALDYLKLLKNLQERSDLRVALCELSGMLEELRAHSQLRNIVEDLQALDRLDKLDDQAFDQILERLSVPPLAGKRRIRRSAKRK
jgi:hypothetical protein